MIRNTMMLLGGLILIGTAVYYTYYVWSDCLDENSVLTCMRMLSK